MPVDFSTWVYEPCFGLFARSVTFYPLKSQPNAPSFLARGIFDTNEIDVVGMENEVITDCRTELDILMPEWNVYPTQGDMVDIPWEADVDGGLFYVKDVHGHGNAGGELTLTLSRFDTRLMGFFVTSSGYSLGALDFAQPVLA
jgi:hypothetical protein